MGEGPEPSARLCLTNQYFSASQSRGGSWRSVRDGCLKWEPREWDPRPLPLP